jgi:integrase
LIKIKTSKNHAASAKLQSIVLVHCTNTRRQMNGQEHVVPLSDTAVAILKDIPQGSHACVIGRGQGGFQSWSKCKAELDKAAKLKEPWTIHDLRWTVRTGLGKLGIQPHIAEAALNHLPAKLMRTYDTNKYEAEKRAALDQWATHLKTIVAQATGANVTRLPGEPSPDIPTASAPSFLALAFQYWHSCR